MSFESFKNAFNQTYEKFLSINKLKKEIEKTEERLVIINSAISQSSGTQISYPLIVGNSLSRASITDLGTFPPFQYNEKYIYPLGYTVKKRFKPHKNYKKSLGNKVLYLCSISKNGITIVADDGFEWKGDQIWESLKEDLGIENEFNSLEDFMVLSHPTVIKMIEGLGDISLLKGYVPLSERPNEISKN